jgi:hypothetical protein
MTAAAGGGSAGGSGWYASAGREQQQQQGGSPKGRRGGSPSRMRQAAVSGGGGVDSMTAALGEYGQQVCVFLSCGSNASAWFGGGTASARVTGCAGMRAAVFVASVCHRCRYSHRM